MVGLTIADVAVGDTHPLRRRVLREDRAEASVDYPEDASAEAFHLAAECGGVIVGVATFAPVPTPHRPGAPAWRLRGMAVAPEHHGQGVGRAMMETAKDRARQAGVGVLWADGRDTALGFYTGSGWMIEGDGFTTASGIPHHVVVLDLDP